jgi:hypothetical protein
MGQCNENWQQSLRDANERIGACEAEIRVLKQAHENFSKEHVCGPISYSAKTNLDIPYRAFWTVEFKQRKFIILMSWKRTK